LKTYAKNTALLADAIDVLQVEQPCTLRQLYYRLVSRGAIPNAQSAYQRLGTLMTRAREKGLISRRWIVDHTRATHKPSSWTGLTDFSDTVRTAYRKDFWASLDHHVEIFVEKDAVAGTIQPVTADNDVALHVCRGYSSVSFAGEIAEEWQQIKKPIFAYYLGDFDPSGYDIERDLREKLERYSGRWCYDDTPDPGLDGFSWVRLGVKPEDFEDFDLVRLPIKHSDCRAQGFIAQHGDAGAEIDAIPPTELRRRVAEAIDSHIDVERWNKLLHVERLERNTWNTVLSALSETQSSSSLLVDCEAG
jgi:hypothetical protein